MAKKKKQSVTEPVQRNDDETLPAADSSDDNIIGMVWDFFSSMKLGIILLLVLAIVFIVGTVYIPPDPQTGQQDFAKFYNNLFTRGLMALLALNLLICSLNRWRHIISTLKGPKLQVADAFVKNLKTGAVFQLQESTGTVAGRLQEILRQKGYRTFHEDQEGCTYIAADRGRWGVMGPYLTHIGFIIMIVAIMFKFSGLVGFEGDLATVVGKTHNLSEVNKLKNVSADEYFDLRLDKFETLYRPDGSVQEWRSYVTVIDKNKPPFPFVIKVNHPLVYKGIKFYQMSYGFYFAGKVNSSGGGARDFSLMTNTENSYTDVPGTDIIFMPESYSKDSNKVAFRIFKGQQEVGTNEAVLNQPFNYETASITFTDAKDYSFFSVKRDPTVPYMGFASGLLTLAIIFSFLIRHRRIWAVVKDRDGVAEVLIGGLSQKDKAVFQSDFDIIVNEVKGEKGGAERGLR